MSTHPLVVTDEQANLRAVLRAISDFGFDTYDLAGPPRRLLHNEDRTALLESNVDVRRVSHVASSAALLDGLPAGDNWLTVSNRTIARLAAAYLIAEDPQHRLDAHRAATLMHQVSLVQHVLSDPRLNRVLIADEVGLGKTIEAGLLIKRLMADRPRMRVLYLAPARLVGNVVHEFRTKLDLDARRWTAGTSGDARLDTDRIIVASIHKAVFASNFYTVAASGPWDMLIVDECHHLSDWDPTGGKPNQAYKLVSKLVENLPDHGRLVLMSGTPHQGSHARFSNILRLLSDDGKSIQGAAGRVIYRTKDRVRDWRGRPLFPSREIHPATVVPLGPDYESWYFAIGELYDRPGTVGSKARAAAWAKGQALQWAASSVQAGLGFLARLGIRRLGWTPKNSSLSLALAALRPYRGGAANEPVESVYARILKQIGGTENVEWLPDDLEDFDDETWRPNPAELGRLLKQGVGLLSSDAANAKWDAMCCIIDGAGDEKIILFALPVETVTLVADFLTRRYRQRPAVIIGNQSEEERWNQVAEFQRDNGPRFLVSSRAGGEGLNMQKARRLIHLDVPWNPMELEQRVGRIHRFGSKKTIVVDTVVAAGSREVDMYRIAREKLAMIASHLDPEQFETLFSRVMSVVPPKELEDILGGVAAGPLPDSASREIGRLVTEGYRSWREFDGMYRSQAEQIRAVNPGEATWHDLGNFLLKYGGATATDDVKLTAFDFHDEEIVAVDETLPALTVDGRLFACGDTGGVMPEPVNGHPVAQLGMNIPEMCSRLKASFLPEQLFGLAFLRRSADLPDFVNASERVVALVFLRQSIRQQMGLATEHATSLHVFLASEGGEPQELCSKDRATFVRACMGATRLREKVQVTSPQQIKEWETSLGLSLKRPTAEDVEQGIRHAVWPVASVVFV